MIWIFQFWCTLKGPPFLFGLFLTKTLLKYITVVDSNIINHVWEYRIYSTFKEDGDEYDVCSTQKCLVGDLTP